MPATSNMYVERRLTEVSVAYQNSAYVADQVCPLIPVPDKSGLILEEDKTVLTADPNGDDAIGQGQYPGQIKVEIQNRNFSTVERAKEVFVHDDEIAADAAQGAPYRPKIRKTKVVTERLLVNRELRIATIYTTAGTWASGHSGTPATKWDAASSDPIGDVNTAILKVKADLQMVPNTLVVPWEVCRYLMANAQIKALSSGGSTLQNPGIAMDPTSIRGLLQRAFGIENILMPAAGNFGGNMAAGFKGGPAGNLGGLWSDNVWLGFVPNTPGREMPSAGYTYVWENAFEGQARNEKGMVVTESRDDRARGVWVAARTYTNELALIPEAGYVLSNTLNAF